MHARAAARGQQHSTRGDRENRGRRHLVGLTVELHTRSVRATSNEHHSSDRNKKLRPTLRNGTDDNVCRCRSRACRRNNHKEHRIAGREADTIDLDTSKRMSRQATRTLTEEKYALPSRLSCCCTGERWVKTTSRLRKESGER